MSNTHTIDDLRRRLFETIDAVKAGTLDLDKAKTISDLSQVVVNSAKVEVEYLRAVDGGESAFIGSTDRAPELPNGITTSVVHRLNK